MRPLLRDRALAWLGGSYLLVWIVTAVAPVARREWLLENLLVFVLIGILAATYRRFRLSDLSYLSITILLLLHAVGAYYIYENVPFGFWLRDLLGSDRNSYDRAVHFAFGVLAAPPLHEVFRRTTRAPAVWSWAVPVSLIAALSALYEIVEAVVAQVVSPELGAAYLGSQGDGWDAQWDMACAIAGSVLWLACVAAGAWMAARRQERSHPLASLDSKEVA
jgi:putative membrane protein